MKSFKANIELEFVPDFTWFIIPTIEIDVFERYIAFHWLCFSITISR
jgi:hypothetical protein